MIAEPIKRWLRTNIHPTEVWFFCFAMVRFAAFTAWGNLIVRLIRGEEAKEDWRTLSSAAALITFTTLTSAGEAREFATPRAAATVFTSPRVVRRVETWHIPSGRLRGTSLWALAYFSAVRFDVVRRFSAG